MTNASTRTTIALIVDDDAGDRISAKRLLTHNPYMQDQLVILEAGSVSEALRIMSETSVEVVLLDMHLGPNANQASQNGIANIPEMLKRRPFAQILVLTASDKSKDAAQAIKLGAYDFITKSAPKPEKQRKIADAITAARTRFEEVFKSRVKSALTSTPQRLGGKSPQWRSALSDAVTYSGNDFPVLITGETGTGKTELARVIHEERAKGSNSKKFIAINIAALSSELAERELFGNEPEAFTGATKEKLGYFELADFGTLFLDEIGDACLDLQKKILKVIEEGTFYRLGGNTEIHVKVKIVCATHRNLEKMVEEGTFREDLYMRISTLPIHIEPLSARKQDTPEIIEAMLPRVCERAKVKLPVHFEDLPDDFIDYLVNTHFRGNARGIFQQLVRLIVRAPSDNNGKKALSNWKAYLKAEAPTHQPVPSTNGPKSIHELLEHPIEFSESDFPGITPLTLKFQDRIYLEAIRKYRSINQVARILKVSPSTAYANLKRMGAVTPSRTRRATKESR